MKISQSDDLRHLNTVCLDGLPLNRLLLCCCWGLPSQRSHPGTPKTRQTTCSQKTDFLFHQDLLVLILVSYWKSQFFPLPSFDMSWITRFPTKSFINSLANWFVPCKSEKNELQIQKEDLQRASKSLFLRLQQIDLSGGFPCMLLVTFSLLRIWRFLVVSLHPLFSFDNQGSIATKSL